jgi:hypothetical protein
MDTHRRARFTCATSGVCADGEVVWSWRFDAGAKVVKTLSRLAGDGGNQAMVTRARRTPLKPSRRECRVSSAEPVVLPRAFLLHADHGCQPVPGLPCALSLSEGPAFAKLGRRRRRENAGLWLFDIGIDQHLPLRASDRGDDRRRVRPAAVRRGPNIASIAGPAPNSACACNHRYTSTRASHTVRAAP